MRVRHLLSFAFAVDERLNERLRLRDGLKDRVLTGDIADRPLAQARATQAEYVAAWLINTVAQDRFHFIVRHKSHETGMSDRQKFPVGQQRRPWMKEPRIVRVDRCRSSCRQESKAQLYLVNTSNSNIDT